MSMKSPWMPLLAGLVAIALIGCDPQTQNESSVPDPSPTSTLPSDPAETPTDGEEIITTTETPPSEEEQVTPVTIYRSDSQCLEHVAEEVEVPSENPIESAVGEVIKDLDSVEFDIVAYQVNVNSDSGIATIDMQIDPDSQRQFVSLSSCENFALFGSLDKTLTENEQWNIREVAFTTQGEEIIF